MGRPCPSHRENPERHIVRIEHAVPSYETWKQAFDGDPADRKGSGVRRCQVLRAQDEPNLVWIDLEFESRGETEAFLLKMQRIGSGPGRAVMRNPSARIVERAEAREP